MKARKLIYDTESFGITQKSLKMLRNALVSNYKDKILVVEVPTSDILCGFLIFNKTEGSVTWSGDGFRTDRGGEGGRGYKTALNLLETFSVRKRDLFDEILAEAFSKATEQSASRAWRDRDMLEYANRIALQFEANEYECYYESNPFY